MKKLLTSLIIYTLTTAVYAVPITYTNEAQFQTAAGTIIVEDFEGYNLLDSVSTLTPLGGSFNTLSNGSFPSIYDQSSGGTTRSGSKTLMNNDKLGIPGQGSLIFTADNHTEFSAIGLWNTGSDDSVRLRVFDKNDVLISSIASSIGKSFIGITGLSGVVKAEISAVDGNGWFSIDDLQTSPISTASIPEPLTLAIFGLGLVGIAYSKKSLPSQ